MPRVVLALAPEEPARLARSALERCSKEDRFHDYILGEYTPASAFEGKLRTVNLLIESFALLGVEALGLKLIEKVRGSLGPFRTVWGIKHSLEQGIFGWELYFYDFERTHADLDISRVKKALKDAIAIDAEEPHPLPWHMFSVEITPAHLQGKEVASVDVYIDMRSYKVRGTSYAFENVYTFHNPRVEIDAILHRIRSSVHFNEKRDNLGALMPPSLFRCGRLCVANKRSADALYFSRIPSSAALGFLRAQHYPEPIVRFFDKHAAEFDHLLWDAGIDFCGDIGPLCIKKTSIYGTF